MARISTSLVLLVLLIATLDFGGEVHASSPLSIHNPVVEVLSNGINITWTAPPPEIQGVEGSVVKIVMDGFDVTGNPGSPKLPMTSILIALPKGENPRLDLDLGPEWVLPITAPLAVNEESNPYRENPEGEMIPFERIEKQPIKPFDPDPVELEIVGVVRGVTLARLVFYPVLPIPGGVRVISQVDVKILFNTPELSPKTVDTSSDPMLETLQNLVVNPDHIQPRYQPEANTNPSTQATAATSAAAMIEVSERGITQVTYQDLSDALFPVSQVNPQNLQMWQAGSPVAIEWVGDGDTTFESSEKILFYADPRPSKWTDTDYYLLTEEETAGSRITPGSGDPAGMPAGQAYGELMFEENPEYLSDIPAGWLDDHWYWEQFTYPTDPTATFNFNLSSVNTSGPGILELWTVGYTDVYDNPDHKVALQLNSISLPPEIEWNGKQLVHIQQDIPSNTFLHGNNQLTVSLPGIPGITVEGMWLDAYKVKFPFGSQTVGNSVYFSGEGSQGSYTLTIDSTTNLRGYDVSIPETPIKLSDFDFDSNQVTLGDPAGGGTHDYFVTNDNGIMDPADVRLKIDLWTGGAGYEGADYLVITHPDFAAALPPLRNLRENQGLFVATEAVDAIYDHFDDGRPTPNAIKSYLQNAYDNWIRPPVYVVLVGDGTSDPRHYRTNSFDTYIPPFLADVDPWVGETAADNRYVTMDGEEDIIPDMLIGRFPVNSLGEAEAVVDKIVSYETLPLVDNWFENVTFVADNKEVGNDFPAEAEHLSENFIDDVYSVSSIYFPEGGDPGTTKTAILSNWDAGPGMITYIGHGNEHNWAGESLLHITDINGLGNNDKLPVVLELTCLTGAFHTNGLDVLDEHMLRVPNVGAVAVWGPSGWGLSKGHTEMAEGFFSGTYQGGYLDLGTAILAGKVNLGTFYKDLVDTFTLFGDPALNLHLTTIMEIYIPLVLR